MKSTWRQSRASAAASPLRGISESSVARSAAGCCPISVRIAVGSVMAAPVLKAQS
jgi:hypothetical protein